MPGAGKEEVVRVARDLGFAILRMGDVVRDEAARRGLPITDASVGGMAHQERVEHGFGVWAERTLPRIPPGKVLIDGLRGKAELDVFRRAFGDRLVVIAVHASPAARHGRMAARSRADDAASREALQDRDERELGWGLGDVIATADVLLVNEGPLSTFRRAARAALSNAIA
jgi:dephospho-CoA kinase